MTKTILVAEDYADGREMIKFFLEREGYNVIEAASGLDAVECAKRQLPDLILMDISLPELDGLSAIRLIKESGATASIPVICITAHGEFYRNLAIEEGCIGVLEKPLDIKQLLKLIDGVPD